MRSPSLGVVQWAGSLRSTPPVHPGSILIVHPTGAFDNHGTAHQHIEVSPLAAAMGAEIAGVEIAAITDAQFAEVEAALFRH